jgi:hypothetical protein
MQPDVLKQAKTTRAAPPLAPGGGTSMVTKETAGALSTDLRGSWGSEGVDAGDVLIPRILLMQGLSKLVSAGECKPGDIVRSTTKEALAQKGGAVEIIPLTSWKTWTIFDCSGKKPEFRSIEPITSDNANAPLEYMIEGKPWRRDKTLNFYVLLPSDVAKEQKAHEAIARGEYPDTDDVLFPCAISFSRSAYNTGKELATHFMKAQSFNITPASRVFKLGSRVVTNDQGSWPVFELSKARPSTQVEITAAKKWYDILSNSQVRVHDEEDTPPTGAAPIDTTGVF